MDSTVPNVRDNVSTSMNLCMSLSQRKKNGNRNLISPVFSGRNLKSHFGRRDKLRAKSARFVFPVGLYMY